MRRSNILLKLLTDFYCKLKAYKPSEIADHRVAKVYELFLGRALSNSTQLNNTAAKLKPKRRPEFEKHALLTIKKVLYKRFKSKRVSKSDALKRLERFAGLSSSDEAFRRLFGSESKKGLNTRCIKAIMENPALFQILFSTDFMAELYQQMLSDTHQDITTNLVTRLHGVQLMVLLDAESPEPERLEEALVRVEQELARPALKLPWTVLENRFSLVYLLGRFRYQAAKAGLQAQLARITEVINELSFDNHEKKVLEFVKGFPCSERCPSWVALE